MRLSNLDDCIQDALATREKLASQISSFLQDQKKSLETVNASSQAEERLATTTRSLALSRKSLKGAHTRRSELQSSLDTRRKIISSGNACQDESEMSLNSAKEDLATHKGLWQRTKTTLTGQTRRICEDLLCVYPIEPFEQKPLSFTIRDLHLPNAVSSSLMEADPCITAAALGHVAHIVYLLSLYLLTPIPYPPSPRGSTSTILDPVSANMPSAAARVFPLYQKGAVTYRFEYGVFLLNSDIELLMSRQGSRMVDLRHTLPNLKYLLTILTTGKGELPVRKKGTMKRDDHVQMVDELRGNTVVETIEKSPHANGKLPEVRILGD